MSFRWAPKSCKWKCPQYRIRRSHAQKVKSDKLLLWHRIGKVQQNPPVWQETFSKLKVKLSLCFFNWAPRHEGVLGEWRYSSTHSLPSALDGGEWSVSRPSRFTPRERAPGTHWVRGWVGPRAVLDTVVNRKIPSPDGNRTLEPRSSNP
jgi:hypothetical protein